MKLIRVKKVDTASENVQKYVSFLRILGEAEKMSVVGGEARKSLMAAEREARKVVEYANAEKDIAGVRSLIEKKLKNVLSYWGGAVFYEPSLKKLDSKIKSVHKELADSIRRSLAKKEIS